VRRRILRIKLKSPRWIEWHSHKLRELRWTLLKDTIVQMENEAMNGDSEYESSCSAQL